MAVSASANAEALMDVMHPNQAGCRDRRAQSERLCAAGPAAVKAAVPFAAAGEARDQAAAGAAGAHGAAGAEPRR